MKKINIISIFVAIAILLTGCQSGVHEKYRTSDVEKTIVEASKEIASSFEVRTDVELIVKKEGDEILSYPTGLEEKPCRMRIPKGFYEDEGFVSPILSEEIAFPKSLQKKLKIAQDIVSSYIDNSIYIKEADKLSCKEAIQNAKIRYGKFEDKEFQESPMLTNGTTIYVNRRFEKYICEYFFIHELIHVASNVTNAGTKYEFSFYRSSKLNEAITDVISLELSRRNKISGYEMSAYQDYYEFAFYAISRLDIFKAYYYSDEYENIISDTFDLYTIVLNNLYTDENEDEYRTILYYILNEWEK